MSAALAPIGEPKVIFGRDAYIPAFSPSWKDEHMGIDITQNGKPLGFTLGQMLPERRWCVQETGELMDQRDFESLYQQFASYTVVGGKLVNVPAANGYFDVKLIPVPRIERFACAQFDYDGREVKIGFDPNKPPAKSEAPVVLRDHRGYEVAPQNPNDTKVARLTVLADLKNKGLISDEALASEMGSILLEPQPAAAPAVPEGFAPAPVEAEPEATVHTAPCGFQARSKAGAAAHARNCADCKATPETVEA